MKEISRDENNYTLTLELTRKEYIILDYSFEYNRLYDDKYNTSSFINNKDNIYIIQFKKLEHTTFESYYDYFINYVLSEETSNNLSDEIKKQRILKINKIKTKINKTKNNFFNIKYITSKINNLTNVRRHKQI